MPIIYKPLKDGFGKVRTTLTTSQEHTTNASEPLSSRNYSDVTRYHYQRQRRRSDMSGNQWIYLRSSTDDGDIPTKTKDSKLVEEREVPVSPSTGTHPVVEQMGIEERFPGV